MDELDKIKEEMASLRSALESQKIVSDALMRKVMAQKSSWISNYVKVETFVLLPLILLVFLGLVLVSGRGWLFFGATFLLMSGDVVADWVINRVGSRDYETLTLLDLKRRLIEQQRKRKVQTIVSLPLIAAWMVWFFYEFTRGFEEDFFWAPGAIVGALIGVVVAIWLYAKMQRTTEENLRQIKEMEN